LPEVKTEVIIDLTVFRRSIRGILSFIVLMSNGKD